MRDVQSNTLHSGESCLGVFSVFSYHQITSRSLLRTIVTFPAAPSGTPLISYQRHICELTFVTPIRKSTSNMHPEQICQVWIQKITQPLKVSNVPYRRNSRRGSHSEGGDALSVPHGGTLNLLEAAAEVNAFTLRAPHLGRHRQLAPKKKSWNHRLGQVLKSWDRYKQYWLCAFWLLTKDFWKIKYFKPRVNSSNHATLKSIQCAL